MPSPFKSHFYWYSTSRHRNLQIASEFGEQLAAHTSSRRKLNGGRKVGIVLFFVYKINSEGFLKNFSLDVLQLT